MKVDLEITLPKSCVVTVNSGRGDIHLAGIAGSRRHRLRQGNIEVHDSGSDVSATITKGDARIMNVKGNVRVSGRGSEIEVTDVAGDAIVSGEFFGPIRVRNVAKTTHYTSQKADLQLVHLTGLLEFDSGNIEVSDVAGSAKLVTQDKDIEAENVAGKLQINGKNGTVKVGDAQPPREEISIANASGAVDLTLPSKSNFEINAISTPGRSGKRLRQSHSRQHRTITGTGKIMGRVGSSGPKISIVTSYGSICSASPLSFSPPAQFFQRLEEIRKRHAYAFGVANHRIAICAQAPRPPTPSRYGDRPSDRPSRRAVCHRRACSALPSTRKPSGNSSTFAPIWRRPSAIAAMRSLSFTRSSCASRISMPSSV